MRRFAEVFLIVVLCLAVGACGTQQDSVPPKNPGGVTEKSEPRLTQEAPPKISIPTPSVPPEVGTSSSRQESIPAEQPKPKGAVEKEQEKTTSAEVGRSSEGEALGAEEKSSAGAAPSASPGGPNPPTTNPPQAGSPQAGNISPASPELSQTKPEPPRSTSPGLGEESSFKWPASQKENPEAVGALLKLGVKIERNDQGEVKTVSAIEGQLSDNSLAWVAGLPALETLEIRKGKISSKGLIHFKGLQQLQRLYLCEVPLSDEALKHLGGLTNLVCLSLEKTGITGKGLGYLKNLRNLEVLNLADNPIDDEALGHLEALSRLDTITLRHTRVTGDGLVHLKGLKRLRVLNLIGCKVDDESLEHLSGLKELRMLYVRGTQVSDQGAKALKKKIPGLAVFFH